MEKTIVKSPVKVNTKLLTAEKTPVQPKPKNEIQKTEEPAKSPIDLISLFAKQSDLHVASLWNKNHHWTTTIKNRTVSLYTVKDREMKDGKLQYRDYIIVGIDGLMYEIDAEKIAEMIITLQDID